MPPHEVQKAEKSSKNPEKSGKRNRKSGNLYFYEILRFLRVLTISFSIYSISLFFSSFKTWKITICANGNHLLNNIRFSSMLNFHWENKVVYTEKHKKRKSGTAGKERRKGEKAEEVAILNTTEKDQQKRS